jgi:acyl dehydratase
MQETQVDPTRPQHIAIAAVAPGLALGPLHKGPWTPSRLARWCAAQQNWDRIHYDQAYAQGPAGLAERVVNGALKQHLLVQLLDEAFGDAARLARIDYRFSGPDVVGESLEVHGRVLGVDRHDGHLLIRVALAIRNLERGRDTTTGSATLVAREDGTPVPDPAAALPAAERLDETAQPVAGPVPAAIASLIGTEYASVTAAVPLELGRLYLFADAVGGLDPAYHAPADGRPPTAPPLFPIHALQQLPGTLPLSDRPEAMGREGVSEAGRDFGRRFGLPDHGAVNGGNDAEIHGLLAVGETVQAGSRLIGANVKTGSQGTPMLLTTVLNTYRTTAGRLLLRERHTSIFRNYEAPG